MSTEEGSVLEKKGVLPKNQQRKRFWRFGTIVFSGGYGMEVETFSRAGVKT